MYRIRLLLLTTITWLFFVINIEELLAQTSLSFLNIHPMVYALLVGIFVVSLAMPKTSNMPRTLIISMAIIAYVTMNFALMQGSASLEATILNTMLEVAVLAISSVIAHELNDWFMSYDTRLKDAIFSPVEGAIATVFSDIEKIEEKISWARRFEHELSVIHVNLSKDARCSRGANKNVLSVYLAEALQLIENKGTTNAWYNDNLVLCVPASAKSSQVSTLVKNVSDIVSDVLKIDAEVSLASFPQNGLVLNDLLENASDINQKRQPAVAKPAVVYNLSKLKTQELSS